MVPAADRKTRLTLAPEINGGLSATRTFSLKPVRRVTVYILPYSHTDIGCTEIRTEIEDKQVQNLLKGISYARRTAAAATARVPRRDSITRYRQIRRLQR